MSVQILAPDTTFGRGLIKSGYFSLFFLTMEVLIHICLCLDYMQDKSLSSKYSTKHTRAKQMLVSSLLSHKVF